ncbi:MAG: hypothetical protein K6B44_14365, partial [Lachnospiraceae bacterium]|nr:hypothetical protein [Lachnospiraceae bacterium]
MVSRNDISKKRIVLIMLALMALSVLMRLPLHRFVRDAGGDLCIDSDSGSIFLTDPDSYYHLRMTKDILEHGEAGDTMKDGIPWDSLSSAPEGRSAAGYRPLMAGICILAYRVVSAFTDVSLEQTAYWLNVFISALTLIPVFLLSLKLSSTTGAVTAGILAVLNYGYFLHSAPGFYDTDAVLCCLASSFLYSGCLLIEKLKDLKHIKPYAAAFFCLGIMLYQCWYVYYIFVFIMAAVFLAAGIIKKDKLAAAASPLLIAAVFILEPQL